mmetsp:Transcript_38181/g.106361  ORF Transcript_38181/g.106361 Transcript_38181/m.106361 type:complete len:210 (+) Transcript_38181:724-1353(+)
MSRASSLCCCLRNCPPVSTFAHSTAPEGFRLAGTELFECLFRIVCASSWAAFTVSSQRPVVITNDVFFSTPDHTVGGTMSSLEPCISSVCTRPPRSTVCERAAAAEHATTAAGWRSAGSTPGAAKPKAAMAPCDWPRKYMRRWSPLRRFTTKRRVFATNSASFCALMAAQLLDVIRPVWSSSSCCVRSGPADFNLNKFRNRVTRRDATT